MEEVSVDNDWYFVMLNTPNNSLDIYCEDGNYSRRIEFQRHGLGSIYAIGSFHFINEDSIFVFPKGDLYNTLLINWKGEVIDYSPLRTPDTRNLFNHLSIQSSKVIKDGSRLYFVHTPLGEGLTMKGVFADEYYAEYRFDLNEKSFRPVRHVGWPDEYKKELQNRIALVPNRTYAHDGNRLLSFTTMDSVILYNDKNILQKFYFSHPLIRKKPKYGANNAEDYKELMESYTFISIVTEKHESYNYYRFFKFPYHDYSTFYPVFDFQHVYLKEIGVLIADHQFDKIQIRKLPSLKYNLVPFAGRYGIYIPGNPYLINTDEENEIILYIFQ